MPAVKKAATKKKAAKPTHTVSKEGREAISKAQKKRWKEWRAKRAKKK